MNKRQLVVLWIGTVALIAGLLYVPWEVKLSEHPAFFVGHTWAWKPLTSAVGDADSISDYRGFEQVDYGRLGMQEAAIALLTVSAILTCSSRRPQSALGQSLPSSVPGQRPFGE